MRSSKLLIFFITGILLMLNSCSPKLSAVWQNKEYTGEHFNKLVVIAITDNLENRNTFEATAVRTLKNKGIVAYRGVDYFPPNVEPHLMSKEALKNIIAENEIDGVITMSLISQQQSQDYVQGQVYRAPGYYDPYYGYMYNRYQTVYTPGYYVENQTFVIEAVLHDLNLGMAEEDRLVWRGQSSLVNPTSVKSAATDFSLAVVNYLVKNGVVQ